MHLRKSLEKPIHPETGKYHFIQRLEKSTSRDWKTPFHPETGKATSFRNWKRPLHPETGKHHFIQDWKRPLHPASIPRWLNTQWYLHDSCWDLLHLVIYWRCCSWPVLSITEHRFSVAKLLSWLFAMRSVWVSGFSATAREPVYPRIIVLASAVVAAINEFVWPLSASHCCRIRRFWRQRLRVQRMKDTMQMKFSLCCRLSSSFSLLLVPILMCYLLILVSCLLL